MFNHSKVIVNLVCIKIFSIFVSIDFAYLFLLNFLTYLVLAIAITIFWIVPIQALCVHVLTDILLHAHTENFSFLVEWSAFLMSSGLVKTEKMVADVHDVPQPGSLCK